MTTSVLLLLLVCAAVLLALLLAGGFLALVKLGVIVQHASRPPLQDQSSYSLDQGREVRPEHE